MSREGKRARSAESRRRAGVYLGSLGWLAGFPDGRAWRTLDGRAIAIGERGGVEAVAEWGRGSELVINGELVARSRRTARTLLREHREALRDHVGDVDRWWEIVDAILAWCAKREGALELIDRAPRRTAQAARALIARRPELREAVAAASIAHALEPERFAHAVSWLATRAITVDVGTTLQLAHLAHDAPAGVDALLALLAIDAPEPQPAMERVASLIQRAEGKQAKDASPARRSRARVLAWLVRLIGRAAGERRRALELLAVADLAPALAPWEAWERAAAPRIERAARFVARAHDPDEERDNAAGVALALRKVQESAPQRVKLDELLEAIDRLAGAPVAAYHAAAVRLLAAVPAITPIERVRLTLHVDRMAAYALGDGNRKVAWLWEVIAEALAGAPRVLGLWTDVLSGSKPYVEDDLVEPCKTRADIERLVRVLAALAEQPFVAGRLDPPVLPSQRDGERAAALLAAGLSEAAAIDVVVKLRTDREILRDDTARAAVAIAEDGDVAAQALALARLETELEWTGARQLAVLLEHAGKTGAAWFARAAIAAGQGPALANAALILERLPRARWPALVERRDAPWIANYPAVLAPALSELAAVDPDAEATARRRLGDDLPDPAELAREIAALRAKRDRAPSPGVEKRLANLEARLASPKLPSPKRLANLVAKLRQSTVAIGIERFATATTTLATARLLRGFGLAEWPSWATDRKTRDILFALLRLEAPDRALAGRLLRARSGPPPWDLREDPANRAFLDRLRAAGLDPTSWLDPTPRTVIAADKRPIELALCGDPIEVFAMGAHFETCLAPDGANFFSVVANAADLNKRVLYAKRGGRVVGRCLLAITDTHTLLVFNPYCHEAIDFASLVRDFAVDLAAKLGTRVMPTGTVARLLSRDWYDDGPRDLTGRFAGLDSLSERLATIAPSEVVPAIVKALGHPLDEITLPFILAHGAIHRRLELVLPLVPYMLAARAPATRVSGAELVLRTGDLALADRVLGEHAGTIWPGWPHGAILARLRPSFAIARLRATRPRGVRRLADEPGDRLVTAAVALATLNRKQQAAALLRSALEKDPYLRDDPWLRALQ